MKNDQKLTDFQKTFSERYKNARKKLDLTLSKISEQTGVAVSTLNATELGTPKTPCFEYTQFLISQGINFNYLVGKSSDMFSNVVEKTTDLDKLHEKNEVLENKVHDLERTVSILLGELERLKKELSQSRSQTYQIPSPDVEQIRKANFRKSITQKQPNLGLLWNENYPISQRQATN